MAAAPKKNLFDWLRTQWEENHWFAAMVGLIIGIAMGIGSVCSWISERAQSAVLNDSKFLKALSERVRPICLFNSSGNFYDDYGALAFLDRSLAVQFDSTNSQTISITLKSKVFLRQPPLVTSLDGSLYQIAVRREGTDSLRYIFGSVVTRVDASMGYHQTIDPKKIYEFRVEVLH